jgi:phage anti-repressor protein
MTNLIKITFNESDEPVVSGRELHEKLEIETRYNDWFPRMCEYGFVEGKDYCSFLSNRSDGLAGKPRTDHILTIDMAKQLCMIQRSDIGRRFREYFIEVEKSWNSDEMIKSRALKIYERENKALTENNRMLEEANKRLTAEGAEKDERIAALENECNIRRRQTIKYCAKAMYADAAIGKGENLTIRETAKELGVKESDFTKMLVDRKYLYRRATKQNRLFPYATPKCQGVFVVKEIEFGKGLVFQSQTLVTPIGRAKLTAECVMAGLIRTMPEEHDVLEVW